ncbi:NAD(P)-dependent oxidoreductase [Arcticibacter sp. MXS-1]|uniref:NAD(P)-dependent oxidoreductase n=1 Tax=Arcticibacter sp. MXS-1 TaxID=3341726 RepID=UPI0035A867C8
MKVALIGAGFVGTAILKELIARKHEVTVLLRNPEKVDQAGGTIEVTKTDVLSDPDLAGKLRGFDAVISAYNAGWTNPNLYDDFLNGSIAIEKAVEKAGVKRLIVIGGAGSLYVGTTQLVDGPDFPAEIKPGATSARDYLNVLSKNSVLDWTFFSPAIEMHPGTSGIRKGTYRTGKDNPVFDESGRSVLSVEDVAVVIADELETPKHIRERFTAAY